MLSLVFPGQGSQTVGMTKEFYENFSYVRDYFSKADDILKKKISKIILEGPKEDLDQTENTQPAIFLASYSIFKVTVHNEENMKQFVTGNHPDAKEIFDECIENVQLWELNKVNL